MELYTYKVGYSSYEDSAYWELKHEKKFTEKQFNKIVEECLLAVLIKIASPKERWDHRREPSFATLLTEREERVNKKTKKKQYLPIFLYEMEKHGFEIMEFEQSWNIFGWPSAIKPGDWDGKYRDKERYNLTRRLRRKLFAAKPKYKDHLKIGLAKEKRRNDRLVKAYEKRKRKEKREEEKNRKEEAKKEA